MKQFHPYCKLDHKNPQTEELRLPGRNPNPTAVHEADRRAGPGFAGEVHGGRHGAVVTRRVTGEAAAGIAGYIYL
jgi:hypothetical protein